MTFYAVSGVDCAIRVVIAIVGFFLGSVHGKETCSCKSKEN
jgi:hypothetical protein